MNRLKPVAARISCIAALTFVVVNSAFPLLPSPAQAQISEGSISYTPSSMALLSANYQNYSFIFELDQFYLRVAPFVIYGGEYYSLQQIMSWIQNNYPQVSYSWLLQKAGCWLHYGFNITQLPQSVADNLDHVGFRLVDLNFPLSWFKLEVEGRLDEYGLPYNITLIHIPRAHLTFSFEDLLPLGYTVTHVNSTYILIGNVRGHTNLYIDPITYSSSVMTMTAYGSEDSWAGNLFWEFWNASDSNGWDVAEKTESGENTQFTFGCALEIGNDTEEGACYVYDESVQVYFNSSTSGYVIRIQEYSHVRLGRLLNATTKTTDNGITLASYRPFISLDPSAYLEIFGCSFEYSGEGPSGVLENWNSLTIYESNFVRTRLDHRALDTVPLDLYRVTFSGGSPLLTVPYSPTSQDVSIHDGLCGLTLGGDYPTVLRDLKARNNTYFCSCFSISTDKYVINGDVDVWNFDWYGTNTANIYRQYEYDLRVTWANNSAIGGCEVWISYYGQGGGQAHHGYTNGSGQIPTQILTMGHYNESGGDTLYDRNPYRLKLKKGDVTYIQNFTLSEEMSQVIALQPPEEAPSQGPFYHAYTVDYGSFSLGIQAPKEVHPSFHQYAFNSIPIQIDLRLDNYQIRARDFQLSYQLKDLATGELRINGSSLLNVEAGGYETVSLAFVEPFRKGAAPKNYSLSLTVEVGGHEYRPILYDLSVSHSKWGPLIYSVAFFSIFGALFCGIYGAYHYWPRIQKEAKRYYG